MSIYEKYENPSKTCKYPFTATELGYCWGYAVYVDEGKKGDLKEVCKGCKFYKEEAEDGEKI